MSEIVQRAKELADKVRSWIPAGDGYNDAYANDMAAAADMIELLSAQRRQHRAKHKSYKRRHRKAEAALERIASLSMSQFATASDMAGECVTVARKALGAGDE